MIQGDVCWHKFKEPDKTRPVLILTRSEAIPRLTSITVAPVTSTLRDLNSQVWLTENDGMLAECAINLDFIQKAVKDALRRRELKEKLRRHKESYEQFPVQPDEFEIEEAQMEEFWKQV